MVPIGANVEPPSGYRRGRRTPATVVGFGVVMPRRRLEYAIDAIAELVTRGDDVQFEIIGRVFDRDYAMDLATRAHRAGIGDRVRFLGELAPVQISQAFAGASAAVHAAQEGSIASSGSLLALLAHGVPTVALRTPDDDPVFGSALRYADDDAELAGALRALAAEPRAAERLSQEATATYRATFAWAAVAERLRHALQIGATDERLAAA